MKEFEKILKILLKDYCLKLHYLDFGFNLYLIEFLVDYYIYYSFDEKLDILDNVSRCIYKIKNKEKEELKKLMEY